MMVDSWLLMVDELGGFVAARGGSPRNEITNG